MLTFSQLSTDQQAAAVNRELVKMLEGILEGAIRFNDSLNGDGLQAAIDAAIERAEEMQTPWFAGEYILDARYNPGEGHITEDDGLWPVREALESMALPRAEDAVYMQTGEHAVYLRELTA